MRTNAILLFLVIAVSAVCWWPLIIEPTLGLPFWIPLIVVGLCSGLATVLSGGRWLRFAAASSATTFVGALAGFVFWPLEDGISQSYALFAVIAAVLAVAIISVVVGLACRRIAVSNERFRLALWFALAACVAFGPVALALRPAVVAHREALAAERFASLKLAVERTRAESGNSASICDGQALKRNYAGPPMSDGDWRYIAGNYIREDGYIFGIWIDCSHADHYIIDVRPAGGRADGTRSFCTDESGKVGCEMGTGRVLGSACVPCAE